MGVWEDQYKVREDGWASPGRRSSQLFRVWLWLHWEVGGGSWDRGREEDQEVGEEEVQQLTLSWDTSDFTQLHLSSLHLSIRTVKLAVERYLVECFFLHKYFNCELQLVTFHVRFLIDFISLSNFRQKKISLNLMKCQIGLDISFRSRATTSI